MLHTILSAVILLIIFLIILYAMIIGLHSENLLFQKAYIYLHDRGTYNAYKEALRKLPKVTYMYMYKPEKLLNDYYFVYADGCMVLWKYDTIQLMDYYEHLIVDLMSKTTIVKISKY